MVFLPLDFLSRVPGSEARQARPDCPSASPNAQAAARVKSGKPPQFRFAVFRATPGIVGLSQISPNALKSASPPQEITARLDSGR